MIGASRYSASVTLEFPDKLANGLGLTPDRVKLDTAAGLYAWWKFTPIRVEATPLVTSNE